MPARKATPVATRVPSADGPRKPPAVSNARAPSKPTPERRVPAASVAKAKAAFKNFNLSRFAGDGTPGNQVARGQSTSEVQRRVITQQLDRLNDPNTPVRAMTIALPTATLQKVLPSLNSKVGTVELSDVVKLLESQMHGTEFYASGNATLNRLAIDSHVQAITESIKRSAKR